MSQDYRRAIIRAAQPELPTVFVPRPRLRERFGPTLTLIVAPAGFGKSTLAAEWCRSAGRATAWIELRGADARPRQFCLTLASALCAYRSLSGVNQILENQASANDLPATLELVSRSITDKLGRFTLVLDDFQNIRNTRTAACIGRWIERIKPPFSLVISSRVAPGLPLMGLRSSGMLGDIGADDLRFTSLEGERLFSSGYGLAVGPGDVKTLIESTGGWITGLVLAAMALGKQPDPHRFIEEFDGSQEYFQEYFRENIFGKLSPEMRDFLLRTSILRRLNPELCDAVTGKVDCAALLSSLWRDNLFITRETDGYWYQYYGPFRMMLHAELLTRYPSEVRALHLAAAAWYQRKGDSEGTLFHLLAIPDWDAAAQAIESMALYELCELGEDSRLLAWLRQMPEEMVMRHDALLSAYLRLASLALNPGDVKILIESILRNILKKDPNRRTRQEQNTIAQIARFQKTERLGERALSRVLNAGSFDRLSDLLDGLLIIKQQPCTEDIRENEAISRKLYERAYSHYNLFMMMVAGASWSNQIILQGQLTRAEKVCRQILRDAVNRRGGLPQTSSTVLCNLAQVAYERFELAESMNEIRSAASQDPSPTSSIIPVALGILRGRIAMSSNALESARETFAAMRELNAKHPSGYWMDIDIAGYEALVLARMGSGTEVDRIAGEIRDADAHPVFAIARAILSLDGKDPARAKATIGDAIAVYSCRDQIEPLISLRILMAGALYAQHEIAKAKSELLAMLRSAAPERSARPFLDYGKYCMSIFPVLLRTESFSREMRDFTVYIANALRQRYGDGSDISKEDIYELIASASISLRERQVLSFLKSGLTNAEIAEKLCISRSTVNTHLASIYKKLGVTRRIMAIEKALSLGIL
jgi:LuxR family maltose regulon positive regulatory protein